MKIKKGISLVVLVITIIIMIILTSITIISIENVVVEAAKDDFIVELATLKEKVKEYYMLSGTLPVKPDTEYSADEISSLLTESGDKTILLDEITRSKDRNNKFLVIDLALMDIETSERGKGENPTDIFCVATNTLNVYYINGIMIEDSMRFSLATLVDINEIEDNQQNTEEEVQLDTSLKLIKNTDVWTNEIRIEVKSNIRENEILKYSISGATSKYIPTNNIIIINSDNMTAEEKAAFDTSKQVTVSKLQNEDVIESKEVSLFNLDIYPPSSTSMTITDTSNADYNILNITATDEGDSGIKYIYYDFVAKVVDGGEESYYSNRSQITADDLINFGKTPVNGVAKIPKNIRRIAVISVDNAGNKSEITNYSIFAN